ncbi:MAG: ribosome assembly factor SBDS [Candidatus Woesearchaeota archaeon]
MVDVDKAVIARLKQKGEIFEILVDCDKAFEFKQGDNVEMNDLLAVTAIFKDVKKDERASENRLKELFGTEDVNEIASTIVKDGEIQLTTERRKKMLEQLRKKIVNLITRNAIDPKTGHPIPAQRIEMLMDEARVKIDEFSSASSQLKGIVRNLTELTPIRLETREIAVKIPAQYAGPSYHVLKQFKLLKDEWQNDGSLVAVVEIPAGMQEELENEVNKLSKGEAEIKILNRK